MSEAADHAEPPSLPQPDQICFVVPDIRAAARLWSERYGVGPWKLWRLDPEEPTVEGSPQPYAMTIAIAQWGSLAIELIEPLDEESDYARSLREHGGKPHFHHLKLPGGEHGELLEQLGEHGHTVVQSGSVAGISFAYLGLEESSGLLLELTNRDPARPVDDVLPEPEIIP